MHALGNLGTIIGRVERDNDLIEPWEERVGIIESKRGRRAQQADIVECMDGMRFTKGLDWWLVLLGGERMACRICTRSRAMTHNRCSEQFISNRHIEKDSRILIGLLQFQRELRDMELGSLALRQRRCAYTQGERKLFLVQTDAIRDGGQQLDLGDDVSGDRVRIVFRAQSSGSERDGIISRSMRGECKAVEHYPAAVRVQDVVPGEERMAEGRNPRWAVRVYVRETRAGVEVVLCA